MPRSCRFRGSGNLVSLNERETRLTGSNPPWTKGRRPAAREFADQVAKSRWLRIQSVNHVFALTLTNDQRA